MLPKYHVLFGALFTLLIWISSPGINLIYLSLVFFSSFLIDFDHYLASLIKTKKWRINDSLEYHKKLLKKEKEDIARGIRRKTDFHLFHTVEFHAFVGILGIFITAFFYIFIGMLFHSLLDVFDLIKRNAFHRREYFFFNWLARKI